MAKIQQLIDQQNFTDQDLFEQHVAQHLLGLFKKPLIVFIFGDERRDFSLFDSLGVYIKQLYEHQKTSKLTVVYLKLLKRISGYELPDSLIEAYYMARIDSVKPDRI